MSEEIDRLRQDLGQRACEIVPLVRRYEGTKLRQEAVFDVAEQASLNVGDQQWTCRVECVETDCSSSSPGGEARSDGQAKVDGEGNGDYELRLTFTLQAGQADAAVGVAFDFADWSGDNYVLLPAAVYNGNRFRVLEQKYPPLLRDPAEHRLDAPTTITDLSRLSTGPGESIIEQTTGDVSTPAMGFHSPAGWGFWLLTDQRTGLGNSGLSVEESDDRRSARFIVTAPAVRRRWQRMCRLAPGGDRPVAWRAGQSLTLRLRVHLFDAPTLQHLFDRFAGLRKSTNPPGQMAAQHISFSAAGRILEDKYNRDNWDDRGFYRVGVGSDSNPCNLWQLGWVGGGMVTSALLRGDEVSRERAWRNLDVMFTRTAGPSGFLYGIGDGERFWGDGFKLPHPADMVMVRKNADALYWAIKQFDLLGKLGRQVPAAWKDAAARLADAFVRLWERYGQFGQFAGVRTGELIIGGSTAGAMVPGGLALAGAYFDRPAYLDVARAAAGKYCDEDLRRGLTTGGPGEILSAPDSESAFALLESLVCLYEVTLDGRWLGPARDLLRQCATWVVSYDYVFPAESPLGRAGAQSTGAVWANVQNKHGAPGICTLSGDCLLKLFRATGDHLAIDLLRDIAHHLGQYLCREDRPLAPPMRPGWICERVNLSDWEGPQNVGGALFGSCWPEVSLMLTAVEVPGLYVQPDSGFYYVFDHVDVAPHGHDAAGLHLRISNPTKFPARVSVLCESSSATSGPLGHNALLGCRTIALAPGQAGVETFI